MAGTSISVWCGSVDILVGQSVASQNVTLPRQRGKQTMSSSLCPWIKDSNDDFSVEYLL